MLGWPEISEVLFFVAIGVHVAANRLVLNAFDQAQSKQLQGNAERDIAIAKGLVKIRLFQAASRRVGTALQREQAVHTAVPRSVRIELETNLPERPVWVFEGWHRVRSTETMRDLFRWTVRRSAASNYRLRMADETLIRVEYRAHPRRVDQRCRRKRIVGVGIDGRNTLRLLRARVARAFQL